VPFVSRAAYEQRRLANQLAKARMHQLLGERKQQQQQQEQQQQQGAEQEVEVVITTRRGIQDAVAAQAGERVAKAAVEFVYRYQRWGSLEESAAAAQWRVGVALAAQARTLRQESPGCCSSAVLRHYRTAHRTAKREHELLHLALAQVQQAQAQQS
jgi:hypothetical protein